MVRYDPANPQNEAFLDDWRFELYNIDDQARPLGPTYYGMTGPDGNGLIGLPMYMFALPLIVAAYNDVFPWLIFDHNRNDSMKESRIQATNCQLKRPTMIWMIQMLMMIVSANAHFLRSLFLLIATTKQFGCSVPLKILCGIFTEKLPGTAPKHGIQAKWIAQRGWPTCNYCS